jgi:hypothetical protein
LNRIMIASFCWSMISGQTLRVCPEGKPVPTFPDRARKAARLVELGLKRGKGPPPPVFRFDCAPDHISVANPDLFISYRTFPQSGPLGKAVQRSTPLGRLCFFDRGRSPTAHPLSLVGSHWLKPGALPAPLVETLASADAFLDVDPGFPRRSWIHRSRARLLRKARL